MGDKTFFSGDWREWRRLRALHLKQQSWSQRSIAAVLGVSEDTVGRWLARVREGGIEALHRHPAPGRMPKLSAAQKGLLPDFLWHGAEAYGFRGDVWTCGRVAQIIQEEFGVRYHQGHVSRLLKELGWTPQVPLTRAIQRDEEAIRRWRDEIWPGLYAQARHERRTLVFVDESGFYLLPGVVRTYGPKGQTPTVDEWQTRDHLSVMGGITPKGKVYTLVRQKALTGLDTIAFLMHLGREIRGRTLVIWDGSPIHRRAEVKEFVTAVGEENLRVEPLPAYAPDLNPIEWLWQHLKNVEMRNQACRDLEELHQEFHLAVARVRQKPHLIPSFFAGAKVEI